MKIVKKLMMCGLVAMLSIGLTACGEKKTGDTTVEAGDNKTTGADSEAAKVVLATVNGVEILQGDLDEIYNSMVAEYQSYYGESEEMLTFLAQQKPGLLTGLINRELLKQKAKELNITCTDEEVEEIYNNLVTTYGEEQVQKVIADNGFTAETYKAQIKEDETLSKVQEKMQEGDINITDEDIKKYYDENIDSFTTGAGANMEHILVRVTDSDTDDYKKKCDEAVKEIEKEIANGTTFDELKTQYTAEGIDTNMYVVEDLGFVQYEQPNFDTAFLAGAKEVKEGEISKAVKSSFGYHFIKVEGIKDKEVKALEDVKDQIKTTLENEKKNEYYNAKLEEWTKAAKIEKFEDRIQ